MREQKQRNGERERECVSNKERPNMSSFCHSHHCCVIVVAKRRTVLMPLLVDFQFLTPLSDNDFLAQSFYYFPTLRQVILPLSIYISWVAAAFFRSLFIRQMICSHSFSLDSIFAVYDDTQSHSVSMESHHRCASSLSLPPSHSHRNRNSISGMCRIYIYRVPNLHRTIHCHTV